MTLRQWCLYTDYYATRTEDGLREGACENCNLCNACKCTLHCNYQVFSDLISLPTKEEVDREMERMLGYYKASYPPGMPSLKGKYFHEWEYTGRGHTYDFITGRWTSHRKGSEE